MVVKADESTDPVPTVYSELHSGRVRHVGVTCVIRQLILCILTTAAGANLNLAKIMYVLRLTYLSITKLFEAALRFC